MNREPKEDFYDTLTSPAECQIKIERSRFLALAFPVRSDAELSKHLAAITKRHFNASHHYQRFEISVSFAAVGALFRLLSALDVVLVSEQYGDLWPTPPRPAFSPAGPPSDRGL